MEMPDRLSCFRQRQNQASPGMERKVHSKAQPFLSQNLYHTEHNLKHLSFSDTRSLPYCFTLMFTSKTVTEEVAEMFPKTMMEIITVTRNFFSGDREILPGLHVQRVAGEKYETTAKEWLLSRHIQKEMLEEEQSAVFQYVILSPATAWEGHPELWSV